MMVNRSSPSPAQPKTIKVRSAARASSRVKVDRTPASAGVATATTTPRVSRRKAKEETRTRVYWAVFNPDLKRVALFEFDQKQAAEKRADKLTKTLGGPHFIQKVKAVVQA